MAMEDLRSLLCYEESVEELKEKIVYLTYEVEWARMEAEEEGRKRKEVVRLLEAAYKERDEGKLLPRMNEDPESEIIYNIAAGRPLPEKGKLLAAVSGVGPLLQSLMVSGPLPRWRNPPPLLPLQLPPLPISIAAKRSFNTAFMCFNNNTIMLPTPKRHTIQ